MYVNSAFFIPKEVALKDQVVIREVFEDDAIEFAKNLINRDNISDILKKYMESDEKNLFNFITNLETGYAEDGLPEFIKSGHDKLQKIQEKIGEERTFEQVYGIQGLTGEAYRRSINKTIVGIILQLVMEEIATIAIIGRIRKIVGTADNSKEFKSDVGFFDQFFAATLVKNDFKYKDFDFSNVKALKGKTGDEAFQTICETCCRGKVQKLNDALNKFSADMMRYVEDVDVPDNIINLYFKDKSVDEMLCKIIDNGGDVMAILGNHVEPNEDKKEIEWTETELRAKKVIEAIENNEGIAAEIKSKFDGMEMGDILENLNHVEPNDDEKEVKWTEAELKAKALLDLIGNNEEILKRLETVVEENG